MAAVEIRDLTRVYRTGKRRSSKEEVVALDGVTLDMAEGEIHGLLGPNGAGKTTLVKILSTVLLPSAGTARVMGFDVVRETEEVRNRIGIVFGGERGLYFRLTPRRILRYWAALYKLPDAVAIERTDRLIDLVGLSEWAERRVETFSRGMKQRLHLARGLIADPPVLFLDEPTTGMDPVSAQEFRGLIDGLRGEGRTILLTTHDMAEAEAVCDRISLIDRGELLGTKTPATVAEWLGSYERVDAKNVPAGVVPRIEAVDGVASVAHRKDGLRVETERPESAAEVLRILVDAGVTELATSRPSLEEVYIHVFGDRGMSV
jgi:ABC-2 type transport system ATP-binding protein